MILKDSENAQDQLVEIIKRPNEIVIEDIMVKKNKCHGNSINLAKKYPDLKIIEGVILIINNDNEFIVRPHVWNKKGNLYFDITKEIIWENDPLNLEVSSIKYFEIIEFNHDDFEKIDRYDFHEKTISFASDLNCYINRNN